MTTSLYLAKKHGFAYYLTPEGTTEMHCTDRQIQDLADEERHLRDALAILQEDYARASKPYVDRLVELHNMRLPTMVVMDNGSAVAEIRKETSP